MALPKPYCVFKWSPSLVPPFFGNVFNCIHKNSFPEVILNNRLTDIAVASALKRGRKLIDCCNMCMSVIQLYFLSKTEFQTLWVGRLNNQDLSWGKIWGYHNTCCNISKCSNIILTTVTIEYEGQVTTTFTLWFKVDRIVGQRPGVDMTDILNYRQQFYEGNYDIRIIVSPNENQASIALRIAHALQRIKNSTGKLE